MSSTSTQRPAAGRHPGELRRTPLVLEPSAAAAGIAPIVLSSGTVCLGSGEDCDVRLNVRGVAPRHCLIVAGSSRTVVRALSSMTWLNDGLAREAALRSGDRLAVGPLVFFVREAFPSECTAVESRNPAPLAPSVELLWDEAAARRELAQAAAQAEAEYRARSARRIDPPAAPPPAPPESGITESLVRQREYLAQLADGLAARDQELTAREHELTAREADLRCRRQEIESGIAALRGERRDLDARRSALDAAAASLEADRAALHSEHDRLHALRAELESLQAALPAQRSELELAAARVREREAELLAQEQKLAADRAQLVRDQEIGAGRMADLAEREDALQRLQAELEQASRCHAPSLSGDDDELQERRRALEVLQQTLVEQGECIAAERLRLEQRQSEVAEQQREMEWSAAELLRRRSEFETALAELDSQRADLQSEWEQLNAAREAVLEAARRTEPEQEQPDHSAAAADMDAVQAGWNELNRARCLLEAERADLVRQLQEFAEARMQFETSCRAGTSDEALLEAVPQPAEFDNTGPSGDDAFLEALDRAGDVHGESAAAWPETHDPIDPEPAGLPARWESQHLEWAASSSLGFATGDEEHESASQEGVREPESSVDDPADPALDAQSSPSRPIPEPAASSDENDAVLSLRMRLAELFGIGHPHDVGAAEQPGRSEPPHVADEDLDGPSAIEPPVPHEYQTAKPGIEVVEETAASEVHEPAAEPPTVEPAALPGASHSGEEDSIAAYMERLLARSRDVSGGPAPSEAATDLPAHTGAGASDGTAAMAARVDEVVAAPAPALSKGLSQPDKDQLRANLDSFRELANISARSAVAKHESKKLHTVVQVKLVVLAIAVGLSLALWAANLVSRGSYFPYALAASVAAAVMGGEVLRTLLAFYRWKSVESAALWEETESVEQAVEDEPAAESFCRPG